MIYKLNRRAFLITGASIICSSCAPIQEYNHPDYDPCHLTSLAIGEEIREKIVTIRRATRSVGINLTDNQQKDEVKRVFEKFDQLTGENFSIILISITKMEVDRKALDVLRELYPDEFENAESAYSWNCKYKCSINDKKQYSKPYVLKIYLREYL